MRRHCRGRTAIQAERDPREVPEAMFQFVGPYSENKRVGGNVTHTVAIPQLPVGKLEHDHNHKLPEGQERSGSQCDEIILKMGGT